VSRELSEERTIAVFGEDENDRFAVRELLLGLRPDVERRDVLLLRKPLTLVKNLDEAKRRARRGKVVETLRAAGVRSPLRAAVFHEDADAVEPAHVALAKGIERTYSAAPCPVVAAVPAWEMEAWWFQFPEAVRAVNSQWRSPDQYVGRNVGLVSHAKEKLRECVRPAGVKRGARFRGYEESDSSEIAKNIVTMGLLHEPRADSASWAMFVEAIGSLPQTPPSRPRTRRRTVTGREGRSPARRG
jgi:hypothetical protein